MILGETETANYDDRNWESKRTSRRGLLTSGLASTNGTTLTVSKHVKTLSVCMARTGGERTAQSAQTRGELAFMAMLSRRCATEIV